MRMFEEYYIFSNTWDYIHSYATIRNLELIMLESLLFFV